MVMERVRALPDASVVTIVTVLVPKSAQLNVFGVTVIDAIPQLSVALATTCVELNEPAPAASKATTTGVDTSVTTGLAVSRTVTAIECVASFPEASVAVTTTVLPVPTLAHVNTVLL